MGDPKKCRKRWEGPHHPWRRDVLQKELILMGKYGLRNKKELWIANSILKVIRRRAISILGLEKEQKEKEERILINKLYKMGLLSENAILDDVLGLTVEDILERRLQSIVVKLKLAKTPYQARQLITHGHIYINDRRVTIPGYMVSREEESLVTCKLPIAGEIRNV
ncbi:MAG: 30S ribosomal protein S4 [Candidatus Methanomethyliaceae archaeon]|nr:30S ribosomal protein S4 [Candidatus Methanomethyliaceae archaeon]MCX8169558.1 30S ribosomal protein S4 [Candidatus Methanomethyliaceae archaeon]MDW7970367.1 30S ribosomal protein S4 [Nitrososphaerota archaeon]